MDDDNNVKRLPVRFKDPTPPDRSLMFPYEVGKHDKCYHEKFIVDGAKAKVECGTCGEQLDPMWVLVHLCAHDQRFAQSHARYAEEMKRLSERSRTKCYHCGQMTRISRG
jgi:ribosomal protein S27E